MSAFITSGVTGATTAQKNQWLKPLEQVLLGVRTIFPLEAKPMKTLARRALAALVTCSSGLALAAPLAYDEAVSGDLQGFGVLSVFALDAGVNTVSGQFFTNSQPVDFDSFAFTLGAGLVLTSVQVDVQDIQGNIADTAWVFKSGTVESFGGTEITGVVVGSPGTRSFTGAFGAGSYALLHSFIGGDGSSSYVFSLTVERTGQVPEPGSLALAGLALLAARAARRRSGH